MPGSILERVRLNPYLKSQVLLVEASQRYLQGPLSYACARHPYMWGSLGAMIGYVP